jgi:hypothetical protein
MKARPYGILSLDGRRAAAMTKDGLMLWDAAHGVRKLDLPASAREGTSNDRDQTWRALQFSNDGETLVVAAGRSVFAFRAGDGGLIGRKDFDADVGSRVVVDPHGRHAAVTVFRQEMLNVAQQMSGDAIPRGALMTRVWKIADGADVATIEHSTRTMVIALSRDAGIAALATMSFDRNDMEALGKNLRVAVPIKNSLVLWDLPGQRALTAPIQSDESIGSATFSDDGNTLMTTSLPVVYAVPGPLAVGAGSFVIWDARTGPQLERPHHATPRSLADAIPQGPPVGPDTFLAAYGFGQDGHAVIVAEQQMDAPGQNRIRTRRSIWQTADLVKEICERLPAALRALTADEVRRYVPGESYRPACPQ